MPDPARTRHGTFWETLVASDGRCELTPAQLDIYVNQRLHPQCPLYNIGGAMRIRAELDVESFRAAHSAFIRAHATLSLHFEDSGGAPRQFLGPASPGLVMHDFGSCDDAELVAQCWVDEQMRHPFELHGSTMHRSALLRLSRVTPTTLRGISACIKRCTKFKP